MIRSLLVFLLLIFPLTATAGEAKIPGDVEGNLIVYRVGHTQCSMFISAAGIAKGTVSPSCVVLPDHVVPVGGFRFEVLHVVETED